MPCKHFAAVFRHVPTTSFSSLPERYREHPIFVVDDEWVGSQEHFTAGEIYADEDQSTPTVVRTAAEMEEDDVDRRRRLARDCRELVSLVLNYTYDVVATDVLQNLKDTLTSTVASLQASCPETGGIPLHGTSDTGGQCEQKWQHVSDSHVADTSTQSTESTIGKRCKAQQRRADAKRTKTMKDFFPETTEVQHYTTPEDTSAAAMPPDLQAYGLSVIFVSSL